MKRAYCAAIMLLLLAGVVRADLSPGGWPEERRPIPVQEPEEAASEPIVVTEHEVPPLSNSPVYAGVALSVAVVLGGLYMIRYVRARDEAWRQFEQE